MFAHSFENTGGEARVSLRASSNADPEVYGDAEHGCGIQQPGLRSAPSGLRGSLHFHAVGERKLMNHFVVSPLVFAHFAFLRGLSPIRGYSSNILAALNASKC